MKIPSAYLLVVLVWSTTPLAIQFSSDSLSFISAITMRMLFAFVCCYSLLKILGLPLVSKREDWFAYMASAFGLFPTMLLVYWAAQFISSGLMSVLMGVYPFFVGIFSQIILKENNFTVTRVLSLTCALVGLALIHHDQVSLGGKAVYGVFTMVFVCILWAISSVFVKKLGAGIGPFQFGTGSLTVALPFFLIAWFFLDGKAPDNISNESIYGVLYLVIIGSVISHTLWFYVLKECSVSSVSLIPLITPVLAIAWGVFFAEESLAPLTLMGASVILLALAIYQGVFNRLIKIVVPVR